MEHVRERIEEIKQLQRKRMQDSTQTTTESGGAIHNRPRHLAGLGWVAVGLMIAALIWILKPLLSEDNIYSMRPEAVEDISPGEIRKTNDNIERLNRRMEMLADTISSMDAKLKRILATDDSVAEIRNKGESTLQNSSTDPAVETSEFVADSLHATIADASADEAGEAFIPTHKVTARINLRPSTSLNTTPIAVLNTGTEVEYISEKDDWYYVNTRSHGKGWCSSSYLSPLTPPRQNVSQD